MNARLKQFLAAENITQAQFADTINVVRASVSHVLAGRNNPSYEFIRSIMIKYPLLNIEWLMFGKGKMYKDAPAQEIQQSESIIGPISQADQDVLFPEFKEPVAPLPENTESITANTENKITINQRKVSKVIILFDDGSYQEM